MSPIPSHQPPRLVFSRSNRSRKKICRSLRSSRCSRATTRRRKFLSKQRGGGIVGGDLGLDLVEDVQDRVAESGVPALEHARREGLDQTDERIGIGAVRDAVVTYRVPPARDLDPMVRVFSGTLRTERGAGGAPAARLFSELLEAAFETLDAEPRKLVIVAEGPLAQLPFDALRRTPDAPMLGEHVETVIVPSVTTWLHWRHGLGDSDPDRCWRWPIPRSSPAVSSRNAGVAGGGRLGPLRVLGSRRGRSCGVSAQAPSEQT